MLIIRLAAKPPYRRGPLSSNVRPHAMPTIALQQVSSTFARENAARTLDKPVAIRFLAKHLAPAVTERLLSACPDKAVFICGAKSERLHQTAKMVQREAIVLFRRGQTIYRRGVVIEATFSQALAESLWGTDADGLTWPSIFFFASLTGMRYPAAKLNVGLGRSPADNWQGLVVLPIKDSEIVQAFLAKHLNAA
jgi:hypothetical protein